MSRLILVVLLLSGCLSKTERTLREWEGVYKFTHATDNAESCAEEGPDIDLNHGFFEIDTVEGVDAHLAELRPCSGPEAEDCEETGFLTWYPPKATPKRLDGTFDDIVYTVTGDHGGVCQAVHQVVEASKDGREVRFVVESAIATDVVAPTQEICIDLLGEMADDPDGCDSLQVFEGRKVD